MHYLANLIDPRYEGKPLTQEQLGQAFTHMDQITSGMIENENFIVAFQNFQAKNGKILIGYENNLTESINLQVILLISSYGRKP